ncbi:hypothetical protein ACH47Z_16595 [Streptomyces sp. NPDC020192]|uniref:hypothetical protein n=1 Tax=Streptomyces sp. NPDC020192 TaxID=3365066 RepID=UPI0037B66128
MSFPAALLGTTVRVLRTAAGRRALQLALLVGGLFALGFLCGEQAHAADGTVPVPAKVTSVGSGVVAGVTGHEEAVRPVRPVRPVRAVSEGGEQVVTTPVRVVGEKAVTSVRDVVTAVSQSVSRSVSQAAGTTETRPTAPSLPLPDLGQAAELPVQVPPTVKEPAPRPQRPGGPAARPSAPAQQKHARAEAGTPVTTPAPLGSYGPDVTPAPQNQVRTSAHHGSAATAGAPGRPAPTGDPDGVLGKQAVDGGAPRHGDAHAVTFSARGAPRLVPGAAAHADAPRTRERHRDIPVFPG